MTAVEWLVNEIFKINVSTEARRFITKLEKQAKEMEKQQIIDAWNDGNNQYSGIGDSETYYEKFNEK